MNLRKEKGITLIALVVTIIILVILAGITISIVMQSSLFERAQYAKEKSYRAREEEEEILASYANEINMAINGNDTPVNNKQPYEKLLDILEIESTEYSSKDEALKNTTVLNEIKNSEQALKFLSKDKELFNEVCKNDNTVDDLVIQKGIIPVMTSNTTPAPYRVTSNSEFNNDYLAFNALDRTVQKMWHTKQEKPVTFEIELPEITQISSFSFTATEREDAAPKDFKLQGRNNESDEWTTIEDYTNVTNYMKCETTLFVLDTPASYKNYRFYIENDNGYTYVSLYKIQLYN